MIPKVSIPFQPNPPICTCAIIQSEKCATAFILFNDNIGPSKVDIPYAVTATTINFKITSSLTLSQAPRKVSNPLIIPPQLGNINMKLKTIPKLCAQLGKAVYNKWCGPAQIYKKINAQKWMIDNL